MSDTILAIDFGTSNSLVGAHHNEQRFGALPLDAKAVDPTLMRTLLFFPRQDVCYYGSEAIEQYVASDMEGRLFRSFKSHLPNQNYLGTVIDSRILTLENMVGIFLLELKRRAEFFLGTQVERAVIGRPARYSMDPVAESFALYRMKKAALFAGFKEVQFVPEPLAAAFDYRRKLESEKIVLVGDFGGGTSDFTIIKLKPNSFNREDVLAIDGCPLAGDVLDSVFMSQKLNIYFGAQARYRLPMSANTLTMPPGIIQRLNLPAHIVHLREKDTYEFIREVGKCSMSGKDKEAIERLFSLIEDQQIFPFFEQIEKVKRELSASDQTNFKFEYPGIEVSELFTTAQFSEWSENARCKIFEALERCLTSAQLKSNEIDLVCLTGGTSKVPFIRLELEKLFGTERLQTQSHFHSVLSGLVEAAGLWSNGQTVVDHEIQ
jgi:hypothetical chaperone protein